MIVHQQARKGVEEKGTGTFIMVTFATRQVTAAINKRARSLLRPRAGKLTHARS